MSCSSGRPKLSSLSPKDIEMWTHIHTLIIGRRMGTTNEASSWNETNCRPGASNGMLPYELGSAQVERIEIREESILASEEEAAADHCHIRFSIIAGCREGQSVFFGGK